MTEASGTRLVRSLGIERPGQAYFFSYQEEPPPDGYFRVDTLYTGLSAGTELTFLKGTNPYLRARWDDTLGVFRAGEPSIGFPVNFLGYMEVGRVSESRTPAVDVGAVVGMSYGHKTGHTSSDRDFFVTLPSDVDPILGIYVAQMGPICANGLLHAGADLLARDVRSLADGVRGRRVLVTGGGVVGLLTGLFARHHGAAAVALADPNPERLAAARALGMDSIDDREQETWRWCKERWRNGPNDRGADVVFQCRAQPESLQAALRSLRPQGTVIDLAFYQDGADAVRLGEEFHHNSLTIKCAQIGRVPRGLAQEWSQARLAAETVALLRAHGPLIREHVITNVVPFDEGPQFLADLAARHRHAIQAVLAVSLP